MIKDAPAAKRANESRWTILDHDPDGASAKSARGKTPESWLCVDCEINTAPSMPDRKQVDLALALYGKTEIQFDRDTEVYQLRDEVWKKIGMEPMSGCLCIGCVEKRIGRRLRPRDFAEHIFNSMPGTPRLLQRRGK
jgi:hypothetical protein